MQSIISESVLDQAMALVSGSLLHITLLLPTLPADLVKPGGGGGGGTDLVKPGGGGY